MRILTKMLFICAVVAGLSVAAPAQKGGDQKKPPKPPPPVVNPAPPKPKDDKPKKPRGEAWVIWARTSERTA